MLGFQLGHSDISSARCGPRYGHKAKKKNGEWAFVEVGVAFDATKARGAYVRGNGVRCGRAPSARWIEKRGRPRRAVSGLMTAALASLLAALSDHDWITIK